MYCLYRYYCITLQPQKSSGFYGLILESISCWNLDDGFNYKLNLIMELTRVFMYKQKISIIMIDMKEYNWLHAFFLFNIISINISLNINTLLDLINEVKPAHIQYLLKYYKT